MKFITILLLAALQVVFFIGIKNNSGNAISLQHKIDSLSNVVCNVQNELTTTTFKLDSLTKVVEVKPVEKKKRRLWHKKDSAEIAQIETTIFSTLLAQCVDSSMAKTIVAIAKHESNNFNSKLFRDTNNLFGMTYPPKRPTLAQGHGVYIDNGNVRRFCKFDDVATATRDFVLYLQHWNYPLDIQSPEAMVRIMKSKRYFEAPEGLYLRAVKRHINELVML
jgi:Mannosyl-glycoprotein endo-beta-N-acetylglucosaminidase.